MSHGKILFEHVNTDTMSGRWSFCRDVPVVSDLSQVLTDGHMEGTETRQAGNLEPRTCRF